jgi:hypothetical protein
MLVEGLIAIVEEPIPVIDPTISFVLPSRTEILLPSFPVISSKLLA